VCVGVFLRLGADIPSPFGAQVVFLLFLVSQGRVVVGVPFAARRSSSAGAGCRRVRGYSGRRSYIICRTLMRACSSIAPDSRAFVLLFEASASISRKVSCSRRALVAAGVPYSQPEVSTRSVSFKLPLLHVSLARTVKCVIGGLVRRPEAVGRGSRAAGRGATHGASFLEPVKPNGPVSMFPNQKGTSKGAPSDLVVAARKHADDRAIAARL
jgi:hypothetical protein